MSREDQAGRVRGFPKSEKAIRGTPEAMRVLRGCAEESSGAGEIASAG